MDWCVALGLLEKFQTGFIGIVGFAGVILTLRHNAILAERERIKRITHERETTSVALLTELKIIRSSLQDNVQGLGNTIRNNNNKDKPGHRTVGAFVPLWRMTDAYESFLPSIGLLNTEQSKSVMYAYLTLKTVYSKLPLLSGREPRGEHIQVAPEHLPTLKGMWENLIPDIDRAIAALEG